MENSGVKSWLIIYSSSFIWVVSSVSDTTILDSLKPPYWGAFFRLYRSGALFGFPQRVEEGAFFDKDDPNVSTEMFSGIH